MGAFFLKKKERNIYLLLLNILLIFFNVLLKKFKNLRKIHFNIFKKIIYITIPNIENIMIRG
jgi:hypothetical protein